MNQLLSTLIVFTTICGKGCAYVQNDEMNTDEKIYNATNAVNVFTKFTTRTRNNIQQSRFLQVDDNGSKVWTDDRICNGTISYGSDYERSMDPCSCQRTVASSGNKTIPGKFGVNCDYSYCPQCIGTTGLCGIVYNNNTYNENLYDPALTASQILNTSICIQYTVGSNERVCLDTNYDYETIDVTCAISIGCQKCNRCSVVTCTSDGGSVPVNGSADGELIRAAISFDCSNINGMYKYDQCNYFPHTATTPPPLEANDPLSFIRYARTREQQSTSCFEPTNTTIAPFPPITPASNDCTPPGPSPTPAANSTNASSSTSLLAIKSSRDYVNRIVAVATFVVAFYFI